jgi:hypothetical protein
MEVLNTQLLLSFQIHQQIKTTNISKPFPCSLGTLLRGHGTTNPAAASPELEQGDEDSLGVATYTIHP